MTAMTDPDRIVRRVGARMRLLRFVVRLQDCAALAFVAVFLYGLVAHLAGYAPATVRNLLVAALAAVAGTVAGLLVRPVRREQAASEADRVLGTEERFSTSLAVHSGRTEDPMGFLPALDADATEAARACPMHMIRQRMNLGWRRSSGIAAVFVLAAVFVPLLPLPGSEAGAEGSQLLAKEKEKVAEQARRLERKARRMEQLAAKNQQEELRKLAEKIRTAAGRLAGQKPRKAKAMSELSKLEQEARKAARRYAGMKAPRVGESPTRQDRLLDQLAKALEQLEKADPAETRRKLNQLLDKIRKGEIGEIDRKEMAAAIQGLRELSQAASALEQLGMNSDQISKFLEGLGGSEQLAKLADALDKLRQAMEKAGMDLDKLSEELSEEQMKQLMEKLRDYRMPELSEEQLQAMLKMAEELRKMIEAGQEISFCKGCMGSGMGLGMGLGLGMGGAGMLPGMGRGGFRPGQSSGQSGGMGGPGRGRGGVAPVGNDPKPIGPDQAPGMVSPEGQAQLIRTVRRIPDPDSEPREYEALQREASREAEEAIKRGEIPREYRGYIRRYFDASEGK